MAFPQVVAVNGGNHADATEHPVNLPADISAGDLLLVFFSADSIPTITFPGGWTQLFQATVDTYIVSGAWYRIADGAEGLTIAVITSEGQASAHTSYRITGYTGAPEIAFNTGYTSKPDPPSLTPTWGAKDTLWFASCGYEIGTTTVSAYPASYTNGRNDRYDAGTGVCVGTARRELNAISENPGTFTISLAGRCLNSTTAIQPEPPPSWTGKVMGITNPAKVMGIDVANIAKVHGVA